MAVSIYRTGDTEDDIKRQSEQHVSYQKQNIQTSRGNVVTSPNIMCRISDATYRQLVVMLLPIRTSCAVSETKHTDSCGNAVTNPNIMCRGDATYPQLVGMLLPVRTACAVTPSILLSWHPYLLTCFVQPAALRCCMQSLAYLNQNLTT